MKGFKESSQKCLERGLKIKVPFSKFEVDLDIREDLMPLIIKSWEDDEEVTTRVTNYLE